ncbi:cysteine protease StiP family protein [Chromatium okenii]|uniref:cysteine protease StiP family protein n=2 Tax=Chromatium okenii TaxID=61644 RepID=UPI0026ECD490|nr:cysteine protease StiP family protein [Chromatium okenii]MBV5308096.1 cysteine protease StiP family protein [Chromatium okenii]
MSIPVFSGSYRAEEVRILLTPLALEMVDVIEKERLIQSGQRHYSTLLSRENLPSPRYLEIFNHTLALTRQRLARQMLDLAAIITAQRPTGSLTLVSLARAGTPIGVLLWHVLTTHFAREVAHYSVSILRDRGIDCNALQFIIHDQLRDPASVVFIDGWTGKGAIAHTLKQSITQFNQTHRIALDPRLFVLTDLAGVGVAPTDEDVLIPSSILNATISGLISRSVCPAQCAATHFHSCAFYREFADNDLSVWFIDMLRAEIASCLNHGYLPCATPVASDPARNRSQQLLKVMKKRFGVRDENLIKPGIGEATRVLLRRIPERLIVRDPTVPDVAHLLQLAQEKQIHYDTDSALPYHAVSLIKSLSLC